MIAPLGVRPSVPSRLADVRRAVSYRRLLLDAYLVWSVPLMRGAVVDLGGKREQKRGTFRPPVNGATTWTYVNIDPATSPDLVCDISHVPLPDASTDCIVCTEVLQHVVEPAACIHEALRLLRPDGVFIGSMPLFTPAQGDPYDFRRLTAEGLRLLLDGFREVRIMSMGGYVGVLGMLIEAGRRELSEHVGARSLARTLFEVGRILEWRDARRCATRNPEAACRFTTGFFVIATK